MARTSTTSWVQYTGSGTGPYPITFDFDDDEDVKVSVEDADGGLDDLTYSSEYSVSGSNVYTTTSYAATYTVTVYREPDRTQEVDFVNFDTADNEVIETALDKLTDLVNILWEKISRTVRAPINDASSLDFELPPAENRKGRYLYFDDSTGEPEAATVVSQAVTITNFAETLLDDDTASAMLTTLGFSALAKSLIDDSTAEEARTTLETYKQKMATKSADYTVTDSDGLSVVLVTPPAATLTGTANTDTADKLAVTGASFSGTVTTDYIAWNDTDSRIATVTAVDSDEALSLDHDAFPDGNEDYELYAPVEITLPTAADNTNRVITIMKTGSNKGKLIISGEGAENINAEGLSQNSLEFEVENSGCTLMCNGTSWEVIAVFGCQLLAVGSTIEAVYTKRLTGTTDADAVTATYHGVNAGKILPANAEIQDADAGVWIMGAGPDASAGFSFYTYDDGRVQLQDVQASYQSETYVITLPYYI